jgi:hypothetical protein
MAGRLLVALAALLFAKSHLAAQSVSDGASPARHPLQSGWVSVGLGAARFGATGPSQNGVAAVANGWYTVGPLALGIRTSIVTQLLYGQDVFGTGLLVGARTSGRSTFLLGAVGLVRAHHTFSSDNGPQRDDPATTALAFDAEAIANARIPGVGLHIFGAVGSRNVSHAAVALSVALGWFGR